MSGKRLYVQIFSTLAMLLVTLSSCFKSGDGPADTPVPRVADDVDTCGVLLTPSAYKIVNKTKQTILYTVHYYKDYYFPKDPSIPSGSTQRGWLVDPTFVQHYWHTDSKVSIVSVPLIAIRLDQSTIVYYTGYPLSLSNDLNSWLTDNQSNLASAPSSFYTPMPTVDTMDAYGLFYIVRNAGRTRLGLPTTKSNECDAYTSLDSLNRPYSIFGFVITFTVNGLNKSDIVISYENTGPRE